MHEEHEKFMRLALEEARRSTEEGNSGVGSVLVHNGEVVGRGRNLVDTEHDVTAHAETVALREAGRALNRTDFSGYTLYTTFEPCPMCTGAILLAGVSTVVLGAQNDPATSRWPSYSTGKMIEWLGQAGTVEVITGVLADECLAVRGART